VKSRISPNTKVFQIEVLDYKHRQSPPVGNYYVDKHGRGIREVVDHIPIITLFRRAKNNKQAKRSASKRGSVISCRKVGSHFNRFNMIEHLRVELKPIEVDIRAEEFAVGRDLEIKPVAETKKINANST